MIKYKRMSLGVYGANCYIVYDVDSKDGYIIDAAGDFELIEKELKKLKLNIKGVLLTHGHFDHIGACSDFEKLNVPIYMSEKDESMKNSDANLLPYNTPNFKTEEIPSTLTLAGTKIRVIETPGHTKGSVCYMIEDYLFTGDTLFKESFGRCDLPGGDFEELKSSVFDILFNLNSRFKVLSGHGDESDLGHEKMYNFINYYDNP